MMIDDRYDVLVAGGGVSGAAAAVASARGGARTLLVEREAFLGGLGYSGLLRHICGLYAGGDLFPGQTLNEGIVREVAGLLSRKAPQYKAERMGQVYVLPYAREDLKEVFADLCKAEELITILYETTVTAVGKQGGNVSSVDLDLGNGKGSSVPVKVLIDCSGSGAVSRMAGAEYETAPTGTRQMDGYIFHVKGLKAMDETLSIKVPYYLAEGAREKVLPDIMRFTSFTRGDNPDEGYIKMSIDDTAPAGREARAMANAESIINFLSEKIPAFDATVIIESSQHVMEREGPRIAGEYMLTEQDVLGARKFSDGVVKNAWPIELWDRARGPVYKYLGAGEYYEIPFRCLRVKGIDNLLCAGRCISVTHEALGSTRVMGPCISLGEEAGRAAAFYVKHGSYPH